MRNLIVAVCCCVPWVLGGQVAAAASDTAVISLPHAASIIPDAAPPAELCDFDQLPGREFVFNSADPSLRRYGYVLWKDAPSLIADPLEYEAYQGRRGKLDGRMVAGDGVLWHAATFEDCTPLYAEDASGHSGLAPVPHLEMYGKVHFTDMRAAGENLVGREVIVRGRGLEPNHRLYTKTRRLWFPLNDGQRLEVLGTDPHRYAHAKGVGPFFLKVRNRRGQEGLIKFNPQYLAAADGPLALYAPAQRTLASDEVPLDLDELMSTIAFEDEAPQADGGGAVALADDRGFVLNVASMALHANAAAAAEALQMAGYAAEIAAHPLEQNGNPVYRVQIAGFADVAAALAAGRDLEQRFGWQNTWVLPQ